MSDRDRGTQSSASAAEQHLINIERLIIFSLMKEGATQSEIAAALGTSQASVSRMFPSPAPRRKKTKRGS
jgi:DNA-directed RNA polymerase specialized sigma subunit